MGNVTQNYTPVLKQQELTHQAVFNRITLMCDSERMYSPAVVWVSVHACRVPLLYRVA